MSTTKKITEKYEAVINEICANKEHFVKKPTDFTRNRKLGFKIMLKTIISMQGRV